MNGSETHHHRALLLAVALTTTTFAGLAAAPGGQAASAGEVRFGMHINDVAAQERHGIAPDLGVFWVGPWTSGAQWDAVDRNLRKAQNHGVTPVIQFYYWGNDISRACLENGCWSEIHHTHKSKSGWWDLAGELAWHLDKEMGDQEVIVVLETEFNKQQVESYEPLDGYLADVAGFFHDQVPGAQVALGLGNWGRHAWGTWDRAAGASDLVSLQGLRGSAQDSRDEYRDVVDETRRGAQRAQALFGTPTLVTDLGLSTYPEPEYLEQQKHEVWELFDELDELAQAGVTGIIYRTFRDNPQATTAEYYGQAERHWGLAWSDGEEKPGFWIWRDGVRAARGGGSSDGGSGASGGGPVLDAQAEAFAQRTAGGKGWSSQASGGTYWNLWTFGKIAQGFQVDQAGTYDLQVRARGEPMDGVAPHMVVKVDGQKVWEQDVWTGQWKNLQRQVQLSQGWHEVSIHFTNDAYDPPRADRNLHLDEVRIR